MNIKFTKKGVIEATRPKIMDKLKVNINKKSKDKGTKSTKEDRIKNVKKERLKKSRELAKISNSSLTAEEKQKKIDKIRAEINKLDTTILKLKPKKKNPNQRKLDLKI